MISSFRYYMKKEILYIDLTVVPYCLVDPRAVEQLPEGILGNLLASNIFTQLMVVIIMTQSMAE